MRHACSFVKIRARGCRQLSWRDHCAWAQALAAIQPAADTSTRADLLWPHAQALVRLRRQDEARPIFAEVASQEFQPNEFIRFCRQERCEFDRARHAVPLSSGGQGALHHHEIRVDRSAPDQDCVLPPGHDGRRRGEVARQAKRDPPRGQQRPGLADVYDRYGVAIAMFKFDK